jgi:hypothetical protein
VAMVDVEAGASTTGLPSWSLGASEKSVYTKFGTPSDKARDAPPTRLAN